MPKKVIANANIVARALLKKAHWLHISASQNADLN
jgi:hypothetical protein